MLGERRQLAGNGPGMRCVCQRNKTSSLHVHTAFWGAGISPGTEGGLWQFQESLLGRVEFAMTCFLCLIVNSVSKWELPWHPGSRRENRIEHSSV